MKKATLGIILLFTALLTAGIASAYQYVDYRDGYECYGSGCSYYQDHYTYRVHYPAYSGYYGGSYGGYYGGYSGYSGGYYYTAPYYGRYYAPYYSYYDGYPCNYGGGNYWNAYRYHHFNC